MTEHVLKSHEKNYKTNPNIVKIMLCLLHFNVYGTIESSSVSEKVFDLFHEATDSQENYLS